MSRKLWIVTVWLVRPCASLLGTVCILVALAGCAMLVLSRDPTLHLAVVLVIAVALIVMAAGWMADNWAAAELKRQAAAEREPRGFDVVTKGDPPHHP